IVKRLAAAPPSAVTADHWRHVKSLYGTFSNNLLWLDENGAHQPRVSALLNAVADADSDALRLDAYPLVDLSRSLGAIDKEQKPTADALADADLLLSATFVAYGESMLTGQTDPAGLGQNWHISAREERVDSALTLTLREDDFGAGLVRMRPQDPGYDSLRTQFVHFRDLVSRGAWDTVPAGRQLKPGDSDSPTRLAALRARLIAEGFLSDSAAMGVAGTDSTSDTAKVVKKAARAGRTGPGVYDRRLAGAVAEFQARHAIGVDSMLGKETVDAMNVPAEYRLAQVAANLERYRWLPRALGNRYIIVNVPQFHLAAYDSGQQTLEMKVIVGQEYEDKATPVFSDSMEFVIFRPYWNITDAIARKEIWPKVDADPGYLAANNMEVYNDHGVRRVRQLPGPKNSLGLVKFMFPNDFNIYLHDTPNGELFKKDVRAFSHGCIRLEKPAELAQWVLGWDADRVQQAMHDGSNNHQVNLPKKIPVYIVYFTAYARGGQLYFGNDLYDRDSKLVEQVKGVALQSPETAKAIEALRELAKS
ncbi:MAG TPA: L,D-transpeptidase family protein, partial [Gemmatimonadaceae bacterium]|nr:L,D-transpeptidase family protein [Gemmatimonadaceae bacterium]